MACQWQVDGFPGVTCSHVHRLISCRWFHLPCYVARLRQQPLRLLLMLGLMAWRSPHSAHVCCCC